MVETRFSVCYLTLGGLKWFKRLLFKVACGAVSCDGDIDEREIRELKHIDKSTAYFDDIDLSNDLDRFFENFKDDSGKTIDDVISKIQ